MSGTDGAQDAVRAYKDVIGELDAASAALRERDRGRAEVLRHRLVELGKAAAEADHRRRTGQVRGGDAVGQRGRRLGRRTGDAADPAQPTAARTEGRPEPRRALVVAVERPPLRGATPAAGARSARGR